MRSTAEMIIHSRETIGDVPPELIGASTALVGSKLYLFGGSLASIAEPRLLSSLYVLDLELWKWEKIPSAPEDQVPSSRYFHTMDIWKNHLVVFGGLGHSKPGSTTGQLQVLNDIRLFNLSTRRWLRPSRVPVPAMSPMSPVPRPRHAHLSCVSANHLFIMGGRDFFGVGLDDVCVYDFGKRQWIQRQSHFPAGVDVNHAFAATSQWHIRTPPLDPPLSGNTDTAVRPTPLPYSDRATIKSPCDIHLYNADHLQRKIEVFSPSPDGQMQRKSFPPSPEQLPFFRFPSGVILGQTLIVAGNNSAENAAEQADSFGFSIWTLDLETNISRCVDTGALLKHGSWAKGFLWDEQNKFIVFGKRGGSFVDGAERLVLGWDAVAVVDLEALGIYQFPTLKLDAAAQTLGLVSLAGAGGGQRADFDFLCDDGRRIPCSRKLIFERWPWFREQHARLSGAGADSSIKHQKRTVEVVITQDSLTLSQSYPVTMALLQYFYSLALGTALQRAPAVLSYLLLISTEFQIPHLRALVGHAMHLALTEATADGVYEIAASCGCRSLQIRAFRIHTESKDRKKGQGTSSGLQKTGRGRSNSEGTRPSMHKRSVGSPEGRKTPGFAPSAFTRPLHSINNAASSSKIPALPQKIPQVPPIPSSVTRSSDPLPRSAPRPVHSPQPQHELNAVVLISESNRPTGAAKPPPSAPAANNTVQKKRSQSVGSRIPRAPSRLAMAEHPPPNAGVKTTATATTATTGTTPSKMPIPKSQFVSRYRSAQNGGSPRSPVEGPRQQSRGRKTPTTVSAIPKYYY